MNELNGIIVLNKPRGYTSHDAVSIVRRTLGTRKVGHTGTLDPNAEGVLPICVGKSTKACDMITFSDKEYIAVVKLGVVTDTYDIWGKVLKVQTADVNAEKIREAISNFTGEIYQVPPMYSALKQNGKKLYELARQGIEVERKPRKITIYECELLDIMGDTFSIRVRCSKGTYIRSLCHDIGKYLGCGACMQELIRTKSSVFTLDEAISFADLENKVKVNGAQCVLGCVDRLFMMYPKYVVNPTVKSRLLNGAYSRVGIDIGTYRIYDENEDFVGIANVIVGEKGNVIKIEKAFVGE